MTDRMDDIRDVLKLRRQEIKTLHDEHDGADGYTLGKLQGGLDALAFSLIVTGKEAPEDLWATFPEYMQIIEEGRAKHAKHKGENPHPKPVTRFVELHPPYPGAVWTGSRRGTSWSGDNCAEQSVGQDTVFNVTRNYYQVISSEASLQDYYVALCWTIPDDFKLWALENPVVIDFQTDSGSYLNSSVSVWIYKSTQASDRARSYHNAHCGWASIVMDPILVATDWKPGDVMEIYLKLESRNDYYARVGSIRFNYVARD